MQTNLEEAKKVVLQLPSEEFEKFDKWYKAQKQKKSEDKELTELRKYKVEQFHKAQDWVFKNSEKYMGEWVCLEGDKLIAHGTDALEVHRKAKESGIEVPFMVQTVKEPKNFVGAWL